MRDGPDAAAIDVEIAALTNGREGLARHEGKVVFVPGVAPGDRVRVRIVEPHATWSRAEVIALHGHGPAYRAPPCPWVGACGGCPWQQVTYEAQLAAKDRNVHDALARIGGVTAARPLPIVAAPAEWAYRRRIRLHVDPDRRLGYRAARSHALVEIDACAIADARISALLAPARRLVAALATGLDALELVVDDAGHVVLSATARGPFRPRDTGTLHRFVAATPGVAGILLRGRGWRRRVGQVRLTIRPEAAGPPIAQDPDSFSQVNPEANRLLVAAVVGMAAPATRALDLHCGAGNLSLALARAGVAVLGVDRDRAAVAAARAAAARAGLAERARFEVADAVAGLADDAARGVELVILDPPRTGAPDVVAALARLRSPRVLYVSCDPATLARDARTLAGAGYAVDRVQPLDLFPQTEHVETILEAVLTGPDRPSKVSADDAQGGEDRPRQGHDHLGQGRFPDHQLPVGGS